VTNAYTDTNVAGAPSHEIAPAASPQSAQGVGPSLSLPPGSYVVDVTLAVTNQADFLFQDNHRVIECYLSQDGDSSSPFSLYVNGSDTDDPAATLSFGTVASAASYFYLTLECTATDGGTDQSYVYVTSDRITAIAVDNIAPGA
jgi:hypothetical protein